MSWKTLMILCLLWLLASVFTLTTGSHWVALAGLRLKDLPASASGRLGLKPGHRAQLMFVMSAYRRLNAGMRSHVLMPTLSPVHSRLLPVSAPLLHFSLFGCVHVFIHQCLFKQDLAVWLSLAPDSQFSCLSPFGLGLPSTLTPLFSSFGCWQAFCLTHLPCLLDIYHWGFMPSVDCPDHRLKQAIALPLCLTAHGALIRLLRARCSESFTRLLLGRSWLPTPAQNEVTLDWMWYQC